MGFGISEHEYHSNVVNPPQNVTAQYGHPLKKELPAFQPHDTYLGSEISVEDSL